MQERLTKKAKAAIEYAHETAVNLEHSYIGTEHLLVGLAMTEDSVAGIVLNNFKVTSDKLVDLIEQYIDPMSPIGLAEPDGFTPKAQAMTRTRPMMRGMGGRVAFFALRKLRTSSSTKASSIRLISTS